MGHTILVNTIRVYILHYTEYEKKIKAAIKLIRNNSNENIIKYIDSCGDTPVIIKNKWISVGTRRFITPIPLVYIAYKTLTNPIKEIVKDTDNKRAENAVEFKRIIDQRWQQHIQPDADKLDEAIHTVESTFLTT